MTHKLQRRFWGYLDVEETQDISAYIDCISKAPFSRFPGGFATCRSFRVGHSPAYRALLFVGPSGAQVRIQSCRMNERSESAACAGPS